MRKIIILLCVLFTGVAAAETIDITWHNEDRTTYDTTTCNVGDTLVLPTTPTKRGYTFLGWVKYTPIEYIESTGTQWINTDIVSNGIGLKTEVKLQLTTNTSADQAIIGRSGPAGYEVYFSQRKYIGTYHQNQQESVVYIDYLPGTLYTINSEMTNTGIYQNVNGLSYIYTGNMDNLSPANILLFRHNSKYNAYAKVYYVKIWNNGLLVRDFIPVLDPDGVPGMYDLVTDTLFYNSGTGDFIAGPAIGE